MFPLRDDIQPRSAPVVNYILIAVTTATFLAQLGDDDGLVTEYGMIPARVSYPDDEIYVEAERLMPTPFGQQAVVVEERVPRPSVHPWVTVVSCIFLHGGWLHLLGNLWFLYIFGDNVEDRMGKVGYLAFYVVSGAAASLTHYAFQTESTIPTIGASGAVAGVMGAYMFLYPMARVTTLIPIFFIIQIIVLPAPIFLGIWFVIQLAQGTFSMGDLQAAGVAWWAHAGGFAFGFVVAKLLHAPKEPPRPRVRVVRVPPSDPDPWG